MEGFDELTFPDDFRRGASVLFVYIRGYRDVPDGFYEVVYFFDVVVLTNASGQEFVRNVIRTADPTPFLGPRLSVISTSPAASEVIYMYDQGTCWCWEIDTY